MTSHLRTTIVALLRRVRSRIAATRGAFRAAAPRAAGLGAAEIRPHARPPRAALEPHCGDAYTFCSLTGCGDGKTLCETIAMDEQAFIKDIVHNNRARFSRCFADYLRVDPTADGIVETRFTIDAEGAVAGAATATGIHPSVEACVVTACAHSRSRISPVARRKSHTRSCSIAIENSERTCDRLVAVSQLRAPRGARTVAA